MSVLALFGNVALFLSAVVLWVHLAADVLRFRDLQGAPAGRSGGNTSVWKSAWRRLFVTTVALLLVLALAAALDSSSVIIALGWCIALRLLAWVGLRLALRLGWHAATDSDRPTD